MSDLGTKKTDKEVKKVDKKLQEVYSEAEKDISDKLNTFTSKFKTKDAIHQQELKEGKITQEDYNNWLSGQVFQSEQWTNKKNQICKTMTNTNKTAVKMVNGSMYNVFAFNSNYQAYEIEKGFGVNFGFGLYDTTTVTNLVKNDPQILPKWKIDEKKDYIWNYKKVNNAITQGIIQGESLDQISKRLSTGLCAQNENTMKTFARTGMTQAQNAGRYQRQMEAKKLGINMLKEWMSTLDGRTRDSHRHMDGEQIKVGDKWHPQKFSNGCRYPGDPEAPPQEVYNCRCTLVADLVDYPSEKYERYDNIDGKPIKNMTYDEWAEAKGGVGHTRTKYNKKSTAKKITASSITKASTSSVATTPDTADIDYSKYLGKDVYDIMEKSDFRFEKLSSDDFDILSEAVGKSSDYVSVEQLINKAGAESTARSSTTSKVISIEGAKPRTADYITNVTDTGISNYGGRVKDRIDKSLDSVADSLGIKKSEAKQAIEEGLAKIVDGSEFTMRIKASNLEKVLSGGSFKNQFETGKSGGCFNPSMRKKLENQMFNVPLTGIDDADRPVYGMFCPTYDASSKIVKDYYAAGAGSWYGDGVTVVLKKQNVINNATMTIGDSLDYEGRLVGTEVNNISFAGSYDGAFSDGSNLAKIAKLGLNESSTQEDVVNVVTDVAKSGDHYFEYQLHGKETHSADNIDYVVIEKVYAGDRYDKLIKKLEKKGIPYTIIDRFN
jgi:SPP1 gp7 family putative phage head morphogenesis protein